MARVARVDGRTAGTHTEAMRRTVGASAAALAMVVAGSLAPGAGTAGAAGTPTTPHTVERVPGGAHGTYLVPAGIHKIKHVIIIEQENRSFDSYFGTFPGADGIPMRHGRPAVCVPDPERWVRPVPTMT